MKLNIGDTTAAKAAVEVQTEPVKRGRRAGKSTVSANEITIAAESNPLEAEVTDTEVMTVVVKKGRGKAPKKAKAVSETTSDQKSSIEGMETIDEVSKNTSKSVNRKPDLEVTHMVTPLPKQRKSRRNDTIPICKVDERTAQVEEQKVVRGKGAITNVEVIETAQSTYSKRAHHGATESTETSTAEAAVRISKPVNKRNTARNTKKIEEADLSNKAVPK